VRVSRLIDAWAEFVVAKRALVIIFTLLLLPLILFTGGTIPFDNSTARYFIAGDPTLEDYDTLLELFGDNEYLIVGIEAAGDAEDVFSAESLDALVQISEFLEFHPYVTQLRSLTNYQYLSADDFSLRTEYILDDPAALAEDPQAVDQVKTVLRQEPLALGTLITEDFRHTRIAARVEYREETSEHKIELVQALYSFIDEQNLAEADSY
ncbi:unnamed protein product, partial [Discosporangium mesarthrocarpum]